MQRIAQVALLVDDYDDAIAFYVDRLGFVVKEDTPMGGAKRWVVVGPAALGGRRGSDLLLARAINERQRSRVGDQTGGRVFLFLTTDDFAADYARLRSAGVTFLEVPRLEPYGSVAVFEDLYGNRWDLLETVVK